jgi:Family of unknown function (DUF5724)/Domain of unknown function (DUF4132)
MTKQELEKMIADAQLKQGSNERFDRLEQLKGAARTVALDYLGLEMRDLSKTDLFRKKIINANDYRYQNWDAEFIALTPEDRLALLEAWFTDWTPAVMRVLENHRVHSSPFNSQSAPQKHLQSGLNWLEGLMRVVAGWEQPLDWWIAHCHRVNWNSARSFAPLFAAFIDLGGKNGDLVFEHLSSILCNEHPTGMMDVHVIKGFLLSDREEAWELIEKLLIAAQRQEGLRQSIFNSISDAHPKAFRRMLHLILEHDLIRFSSTVQYLQSLLPFVPSEPTPKQVQAELERLLYWLEMPEARQAVISGTQDSSLQELYLAFWAASTEDVEPVIGQIETVWLNHPEPERRFTAIQFLNKLRWNDRERIGPLLTKFVQDDDLRIVAAVLDYHTQVEDFSVYERLLERVPEVLTVISPLDGTTLTLSPNSILRYAISSLHGHSIQPALKYWSSADEDNRRHILQRFPHETHLTPEMTTILFESLALATLYQQALNVYEARKIPVTASEFMQLEKLLARKTANLRRDVIAHILKQDEAIAQASGERLAAAKKPEQRAAGTEILAALEAKRTPTVSLDNGLGLFDPSKRTPVKPPHKHPTIRLITPAAIACVKSLHALVVQHLQTVVTVTQYDVTNDLVLGNLKLAPSAMPEQRILLEVWQDWFETRSDTERDDDGFELLRAMYALNVDANLEHRTPALQDLLPIFAGQDMPDLSALEYRLSHVQAILQWLMALNPSEGIKDFKLDAAEHTLAWYHPVMAAERQRVPAEEKEKRTSEQLPWVTYVQGAYHSDVTLVFWMQSIFLYGLDSYTDAQCGRIWHLQRFGYGSGSASFNITCNAWRGGTLNDTDMLHHMVGRRGDTGPIQQLTTRIPAKLFETHPKLKAITERIVDRVLEVESGRGDLSTAISEHAKGIKSFEGANRMLPLLKALGKEGFIRGYIYQYGDLTRVAMFSQLIRASFPAANDTPEGFAALVKTHGIPEQRLFELGMYAPQWAHFVAHAVGWDGAAQGIWWLHAHTKSSDWSIDQGVQAAWKAEIAEQTPLTSEDLLEGAVDVQWFGQVHAILGTERWQKLYEAAKYASSGAGHTRAKLFAEAMLGNVAESDVLERIKSKRNQDNIRALGLLPLGENAQATALARYKVIQEFLRTSKKAGGQQKQASEALAARIGMQNLAYSAGYADPMRLTWAMETSAVSDLKDGSVRLEVEGVQFMLSINPLGEPEFEISKNGKPLKDVPASLKKNEAVTALRERKKELERQVSRMRSSLETAMVRGDHFTGAELVQLFDHPMLRAMLKNLIWLLEPNPNAAPLPAFGFPEAFDLNQTEHGIGTLIDFNRAEFAFQANSQLRIAHPHDLFTHEVWAQFQTGLFEDVFRIQPFKQVFRELYPLIAQEQNQYESLRYAGYQVNPKQSVALLGARGWVVRHEEAASKTFFEEHITAWVESDQGWTTPAEVEAPKLERVYFSKRGEYSRLKLEDVPARVFSEVMRDLDLVVSVAHVGGVDPEASMSTLEMRTAMVRETCRLLKLENVRIEKNLVLIEGKLNKYSVHLGSGTVHQQPGGYVCIVAVQSQQRGRVFLPFADNDPRTAEVIAKVMLLAKDNEIQDPILLRQIA